MISKNKFSDGEIKQLQDTLVCLAELKLNKKQKRVLLILNNNSLEKNATKITKEISLEIKCSQSTIWNILRSLKNYGFIQCGNKSNKRQNIVLTASGKFIVNFLIGGKNVGP